MKILQIYNQYRSLFGGEETVVLQISDLVEKHGGEARLLMRSSRGLDATLTGKARVFLSGIYNPFSRAEVKNTVKEFRPDVTHVHNLYPLYSPSVLLLLKEMGIPIVMTVHNHFHTCPTADHFHKEEVCELCVGGREYHCALQNCRGSLPESIGYALRSAVARKMRLFTGTVDTVIALNEFAKARLETAGFDADRVVVLPNMVDFPADRANPAEGQYVVFSGRMCPEKGISTLLDAAKRVGDIPIHLLGGGPTLEEHRMGAPPNAVFLGQVSSEVVAREYRKGRFLVVPSRWFEGCPLVILEAMSHGLPVIASRIGGLPELVEDGVTGLLFEPGNGSELAEKMRTLWNSPDLCKELGEAGRMKIVKYFREDRFWNRLEGIYKHAVRMGNSNIQVRNV